MKVSPFSRNARPSSRKKLVILANKNHNSGLEFAKMMKKVQLLFQQIDQGISNGKTNLAVRTRARGARKMTWLMATVRGREMIGELPALFFNLFQRTGSNSIGTQKGNTALNKCSSMRNPHAHGLKICLIYT